MYNYDEITSVATTIIIVAIVSLQFSWWAKDLWDVLLFYSYYHFYENL